ncbi:MAG: phytoene/squalene synthase family protein [Kiritimatiellae bacterium]|nr:phytoene/squalene synthase family protein [Kiritimatiellia bacterium]
MRAYTTSFFLASRFLPRRARHEVELIYAAVRYPDEIVDTFPWTPDQKRDALEAWRSDYARAMSCADEREALRAGVPPWLAGFLGVSRRRAIPDEHYHDFITAMERDIEPPHYETMDELIRNYVHGSAIVVGYFLAHVYGARSPEVWPHVLESARELGIGLQLTNFARDVAEDGRRHRLYIPLSMLREAGGDPERPFDAAGAPALEQAARALARSAEECYARAERGVDAFAADCRSAIRSCIGVYRALNGQILAPGWTPARRASAPLRDKWRILPPSKYWRIPLARLPGW